ncbi:hypothetical protein [Vibrio phage VpKK5]|uniref:hypothetical protein n=1 Tax=Vibrio phage VpKK5 TaxID=1538804 RepID=UPI0004F8A481|nr:hypothetical protein VC55_gp74 [Vibrio phage VpKK5]AIM40577.1 hypothetical protein [Vibrio phage VpKK5]
MAKITKAQATKIVEGFNFEVQTNQGQYKFRNGTLAMRGSDIARRHSLRHCLEHGTPAVMQQVTVDQISDIIAMEATDDAWFTKQAGF